MRKDKRLISYFGLFIPSAVALILYSYLGSFTRFLADDFCSAYYANRLGLLRSIWYWRLNWSGRYTAFGTDWIIAKIGIYILPLVPPLSLLVWLILTITVIYVWMKKFLPNGILMPAAYSLGTVFLFAVLVISPNIPQSLYWWNGMRSYSLPLIILTGYAILFQVMVEKVRNRKVIFIGTIIRFFSMFVAGGLGETYVAFQSILLVFLLAQEWFVHRDIKSLRSINLIAGITGSILSVIIVASAPGNAIRQAFFPPHPKIFQMLQISLNGFVDYIILIVRTPEKVTGLVGAILVSVWVGTHSKRNQAENRWVLMSIIFGSFALSLACIVPSVFATSETPPSRAWIIPVFIGMACLMYAGFLAGEWYEQGKYQSSPVKKLIFIFGFLRTSYSALITAKHLYINRDVYIEFAQLWDGTDALILKAKADGLESVQIPAMDNWAGLERPTPKKEYWPNVCYSLYYDIQVYGPRYSE